MLHCLKKHHVTVFLKLVFAVLFTLLLQGCNLTYKPDSVSNVNVEIAKQGVALETFNHSSVNSLDFLEFTNGSKVDFKDRESTVFKLSIQPNKTESTQLETLLIMPHYFLEVAFIDGNFNSTDIIQRNVHKPDRQYSPNIFAFDVKPESNVVYILIKNKLAKKVQFLLESRSKVKNYDQKLLVTFTSVYSIILTLVFVNLVFYIFIREVSYLYYSLYIFGSLFAILFQEGFIAYFPTLSQPVFGVYTQVLWLKLPAIFFWLFVIKFLELKQKSNFDYKLATTVLYLEIFANTLVVLLAVFNITGVYLQVATIINLFTLVTVFIALYIPIKYAVLKVYQAKYLAIGWAVYLMTIVLRIYYSFNMEPLAFWMPRAIEFGLMFEAIILSFGLADKTLRIMKQRDVAEHKFQRVDRELFCKELDNSFQLRANKTIEQYFGSQKQLNKIIDSYFISSLQQLIEVKNVFYVYEYKGKIGVKYLSDFVEDFNVEDYVDTNKEFLNLVCHKNQASYQLYKAASESNIPFIIIPIKEKKHDNMCLFLTLPFYDSVSDDLIQDLYIFANTMTRSLLTVRKFQKTVYAAKFDALTNVLNRKAIDIRLTNLLLSARLHKTSVAIAFIDLDDFKLTNDKYGHNIGDEYLIFLCNKLKDDFKENTFVGRYGGDEFIIVFNNYKQLEIAIKIKKLYKYFKANSIVGNNISISIGIAIATTENGLLKEKKLLQAADIALYKSKENGKNQFSFY